MNFKKIPIDVLKTIKSDYDSYNNYKKMLQQIKRKHLLNCIRADYYWAYYWENHAGSGWNNRFEIRKYCLNCGNYIFDDIISNIKCICK